MIPFASQRAAGQDLATHLQNAYDNEIVEVAQVRGAIADDLHGAFKEWQVQAETLTRCREYLYSLSINPDPAQEPLRRDQYMDYIARTEAALGLEGQPRAIVFHTKYGRDHCHVVWSRIDADKQKAVHLAFDHEKLMRVTRAFARDHGLRLPEGYERSRGVGQESLYEREQTRQTGLTRADHVRQVTEAWRHSDTAKAFVRALADRGYLLATGKRDYVLVDAYGGMHALPRLIEDKAVRAKDVRTRLGQDFPTQSLPSVEEAQELVARNQRQADMASSEEGYASRFANLKQQQAERRELLEQGLAKQREQHERAQRGQAQDHRTARLALRNVYRQARLADRQRREDNRPRGLAAFLSRVSGVALIRDALHRREDAKRLAAYVAESKSLRRQQAEEGLAFKQRRDLHDREAQRLRCTQKMIDARELAAFLRDERRDERVRLRGGDEQVLSLRSLLAHQLLRRHELLQSDLLASFVKDVNEQTKPPPDLMAAFRRTAEQQGDHEKERSGREALIAPSVHASSKTNRSRDRSR